MIIIQNTTEEGVAATSDHCTLQLQPENITGIREHLLPRRLGSVILWKMTRMEAKRRIFMVNPWILRSCKIGFVCKIRCFCFIHEHSNNNLEN
mmetsp:Transcript_5869/g.10728  ORF Transcript_5869/g.10728 Transcript_5869/m.10728 type:complete len:93 (-) Transcript_5869:15-293(-)